jgi:O-antigen/teichoic acid export membrane protein
MNRAVSDEAARGAMAAHGAMAAPPAIGPAVPASGDGTGARSRWIDQLLPGTGRGVVAVADQAAVSGARFLTTVLIGRLCGAGELGVYTLGFTMVIIAACVQEALLATPYAIFASSSRGESARGYAGSVLVQHWLTVTLTVAVLAVTGLLIAAGTGPVELAPIIWVLVLICPFTLLQEFARRYSFAHLRMRGALVIDASVAALQVIGLLVVAFTVGLTIRRACLVIGAGCALPALGWLWAHRGEFAPRLARLGGDLRRNLVFGRWVMASQLADALRGYAMLWLVALARDTSATGAFAAASTIVLASNPVTMGISNLMTPQAARAFDRGGAPAVARVVTKLAVPLVAVIALFCLLLGVAGDRIMQLLYGAEFAGHRQLLVALGLALVVRTMAVGIDAGLRASRRPHVNTVAGIINLAVTCAVASLLVGRLGAEGAAWSLLVGNCAGLVVRSQVFARMVMR